MRSDKALEGFARLPLTVARCTSSAVRWSKESIYERFMSALFAG